MPLLLASWLGVCLLLLGHLADFGVRILRADEELQVQHLPDDAYYYLTLARNFSQLGIWSFDRGNSTTSGFHPLLAYLLAAAHRLLDPDDAGFVRLGIATSSLVTIGVVLLWLRVALHRHDTSLLLSIGLVASTVSFAYNCVSVTEWPLVLLFSTAFCLAVHRLDAPAGRRTVAVVLAVLAFSGMLARSDFGLLPLGVLVASAAAARLWSDRRFLGPAVAGFAGACAGGLAVMAHNLALTGHLLQSSARMKLEWTQASGVSPGPILFQIVTIPGLNLFPFGAGLAIASGVFVLAALVVIRRRAALASRLAASAEARKAAILVGSALLSGLGYLALYAVSPLAVQPWYTAHFIVPALIVSAFVFSLVQSPSSRIVLSLLALPAIASHLVELRSDPPRWEYQAALWKAGRHLAEWNEPGKVGAWNAGIVGFYQGGEVVNLDGLVNDDVHSYARTGRLDAYLRKADVRYLVDFENMLVEREHRRRGGYDDPSFLRSLSPLEVFDDRSAGWRRLTLYRIERRESPAPDGRKPAPPP